MWKRRLAALMLLVITGLSSASSCRSLKPPAGAFPETVGSLKLTQSGSVRETDYIRHYGDYGYEQQDSIRGVIQYALREYPSKEQATAALEAESQKKTNFERLYWEERITGSGAKMGKVLVKDAVRQEGNSTIGYCSFLHVRETYLMYIQSLEPSCEPARKFLQNITF